jgi:hypothetical protein
MSNPNIPAMPMESPMTLMLIVIGALVIVAAISALWGWKAEKRKANVQLVDDAFTIPPVERPLRRTAMLGPALPLAETGANTTATIERRKPAPALAPAPAALSRRPGLTNRWKGAHRLVA